MSLVPALCVECGRVQLMALESAQRGELACVRCAAPVRVVPSRTYTEKDRELFDELSDVVAEGGLSPAEASALAQEVQHALWSGAHSNLLETFAVRLPGLVPIQTAAGRNLAAQRRALTILKTLLEALGTARRSAEYSLVLEPSTPRTQKR